MIDSRFLIREDFKSNGESEGRLIAFYGPIFENDYGDKETYCIAANQYGPNPTVHRTRIFAEYIEQFSRPLVEEKTQRLHPEMYKYLVYGSGLSTITLIHHNHEGQDRLSFAEGPTLYIKFPWTSEGGLHRAELLGAIETIERIKVAVLALEDFEIDGDILPAVYEDVQAATSYNGYALRTINKVKRYLL